MQWKPLLNYVSLLFLTYSSLFSQVIPVHGHRGTRGWAPENSLAAFEEACQQGADYIEFDILVTRDNQVVINHEPYLNKRFQRKGIKIIQEDLASLKTDTFGETDQVSFPFQQKKKSTIPTLAELVQHIHQYCAENKLKEPFYTIEVKSVPFHKKYYPERKLYAKILLDECNRLNLKDKGFIQSFDLKLLQKMYALDSTWKYAWLLIKSGQAHKRLTKAKIPLYALNPNGSLLQKNFIANAQSAGVQVIPWTINAPKAIQKLLKQGVNGIISDYPLRVHQMQIEPNLSPIELSGLITSFSEENELSYWTALECYPTEKIESLSTIEKQYFWYNTYTQAYTIMLQNQKKIYPKASFYIGRKRISLRTIEKKYILVKKRDKKDLFQPEKASATYLFMWFLKKFQSQKIAAMQAYCETEIRQWFQTQVQYDSKRHTISFPKEAKILSQYLSSNEIKFFSSQYLPIKPDRKILPNIQFVK